MAANETNTARILTDQGERGVLDLSQIPIRCQVVGADREVLGEFYGLDNSADTEFRVYHGSYGELGHYVSVSAVVDYDPELGNLHVTLTRENFLLGRECFAP